MLLFCLYPVEHRGQNTVAIIVHQQFFSWDNTSDAVDSDIPLTVGQNFLAFNVGIFRTVVDKSGLVPEVFCINIDSMIVLQLKRVEYVFSLIPLVSYPLLLLGDDLADIGRYQLVLTDVAGTV